jgi:colanic acid/amylovoran biosynthesis glycosyltransferase
MLPKVAYLINQYPKVSHSFIRREILGLEAAGVQVVRFAMRSCQAELVDEADQQEFNKTRYVLSAGARGLLGALLRSFTQNPAAFIQTLWLTIWLGFASERSILHHLIYFAEAAVLLEWCTEAEVSHIHAHFGTNPTTVAMLCQSLGNMSYSFTVHGPEEFDKVQAIALPEKIKRAAFVVAVSEFGKSQLYRWCSHTDWAKIHVIHCGLDQLFLNYPTTPIPAKPRFVCVARLCEQKGHLLLLEAVKQLVAEGQRFKLTLVGDGPLRSQIEAAINWHQLQPYVEIIGWSSSTEVRQQILDARVLVLPSFAEGLPVVLMEALALQRPAISTQIAGIPELLKSQTCGWLISPGSVPELVDAMRSALVLPESALMQMGKAGAERVNQRHNIAVEAAKLAALLRLHAGNIKQTKLTAPKIYKCPTLLETVLPSNPMASWIERSRNSNQLNN